MNVKSVFAKNLNYYMDVNGKTRKDICDALGISYYTVSDWANGKKYPRMDKVDKLADYFGITKADLIEEKVSEETDEKQEFLISVMGRLCNDSEFSSYVKDIMELEPDKIQGLRQMLDALQILNK